MLSREASNGRVLGEWGGGVKEPDVFKIFVLSKFLPRILYARNFILLLSFAVYFVSAK